MRSLAVFQLGSQEAMNSAGIAGYRWRPSFLAFWLPNSKRDTAAVRSRIIFNNLHPGV
jgi:hypothetical protein